MSWVRAMRLDEIPLGQVRLADVDHQSLAICRVAEREVYAIQDLCTHDDGPLGEGTLDQYAIECPRHGARFDVRTGEVLQMPAATPLEAFGARITEDGWVEVNLEADP